MRHILFILLCFACISLKAQSFFKKYTVDTSRTERKYNIHQLDGSIYATTYYSSGPVLDAFSELVIDQLDLETGDLIDRMKFPNEYSFIAYKSIILDDAIIGLGWQNNDGGFSTQSLGLYKMSSGKDIEFFIEVGDSTRRDIPNDIAIDNSRSILIGSTRKFEVGTGSTPKGVVIKNSQTGEFIWEYIDDIPNARVEMRSVTTDDAGNIYALSNQDGSKDSVRLTKISPDGEKLWTRTYQEGFHTKSQQILNLQNGNLLIAGYAFYEKYNGETSNFYMEIDTAGNPIWVNDYRPEVGGVAYESEIKILVDGRIARVYDGLGYPTLMVNHPNGEIDFIKYYFDLDVRFPDDLLHLDDGSFVIVGWINPLQDPDNYTSWLMRTDTVGNLVTTTKEIEEIPNTLSVYPNPTNSTLNLEFEENYYDQVVIYDLLRNEIQHYKSMKQIDVSSYNSGIYIVTLVGNSGNILSRKFVKQ